MKFRPHRTFLFLPCRRCNEGHVPRERVQTTTSSKRQASPNACLPLADLGLDCSIDEQCENRTTNSRCVQSKCACDVGFVERDTTINECLPTIAKLNDANCTVSAQCLVAGSTCNRTTDKCTCNRRTMCEVSSACKTLAAFGQSCDDACQCLTVGATCTAAVCACSSAQVFNAVNNTCDCTCEFLWVC